MIRFPANEFQWVRANGEAIRVPLMQRDELEQALCYMMEHSAEVEGMIHDLKNFHSRWRVAS